jgi:PII-like signaling protein
MLTENGHLLRIFISERDKHDHKPLYEWILRKAKEEGLAGATVIRAMEGFGAHSNIHSAKILDLATDLPIIIEIVDELQKIEEFLSIVDSVIEEGLATVEKVHIRFYRTRKDG